MPDLYRERPYIPARDPLTAIPPSRHPFQFWVMFAMVLSGAGNLFAPGSEVLQQGLDPFFHKVWALTALLGGLLALGGAFWLDRVTGLLVERIGLTTIGLSCPIYSLVVYEAVGAQGIVSVALTASVGLASIWRALHVTRELHRLREFIGRHYR